MKLTFWGADKLVTGSMHHVQTGGRQYPRNTILITGFQAEYTLGWKIVENQPEVPIFGEPMRLRAGVCSLNELSGHADQKELIDWMRPIAKGLKKVFLVHGELSQGAALAQLIQKTHGIDTMPASRGDSVVLQ